MLHVTGNEKIKKNRVFLRLKDLIGSKFMKFMLFFKSAFDYRENEDLENASF